MIHLCSELRWTGAAEQCLALAAGQQSLGDDVLVACRPGSLLQRRARARGVRTLPLDLRGPADISSARTLRRYVLAHQVALLHAHDDLTRGLMGLVAFDALTARVASQRSESQVSRGFVGLRRRFCVDRWCAISDSAAQRLRSAGVAPTSIRVVPPGVAVDSAPARGNVARSEILPRLGLPGFDGPLVGTALNLRTHRGLTALVDLAARLRPRWPELKLIVAGEGDERQFVAAAAARASLSDVVRTPGWVEDVDRLLAVLDVYVAPSDAVGQHSSLLRAMARGCAVAASSPDGSHELIDPGRTGLLVPAGDGPALADAVSQLIEHPQWAEGLGSSARRRVSERFSETALVLEHRRLYAELAPGLVHGEA